MKQIEYHLNTQSTPTPDHTSEESDVDGTMLLVIGYGDSVLLNPTGDLKLYMGTTHPYARVRLDDVEWFNDNIVTGIYELICVELAIYLNRHQILFILLQRYSGLREMPIITSTDSDTIKMVLAWSSGSIEQLLKVIDDALPYDNVELVRTVIQYIDVVRHRLDIMVKVYIVNKIIINDAVECYQLIIDELMWYDHGNGNIIREAIILNNAGHIARFYSVRQNFWNGLAMKVLSL